MTDNVSSIPTADRSGGDGTGEQQIGQDGAGQDGPGQSGAPPVLWSPDPDRLRTRLGEFAAFCEQRTGQPFADYDALWQWSVSDGLEPCWQAIWDFFQIDTSTPFDTVLADRSIPGSGWFRGARINYAAHILRNVSDWPDVEAVVGISQSRDRVSLSWSQLADEVGRVRSWLLSVGVGEGDRVAAYLPHIPETIVAFLATASLGAVWTSCAPEFGVQAVLDRLSQVEPVVLFAVDGYFYGSKYVDRSEELSAISVGLASLHHTVLVNYARDHDAHDHDAPAVPAYGTADDGPRGASVIRWSQVLDVAPVPLEFAQVPPDHPLYVLYSSGTTGLPKPIVHSHGGILVEHLKVVGLHCDVVPGDRVFWFTTTGWMMWNFIVSGLLVGATVVAFDGDPHGDGPETLWKLAESERLTLLGVGAPFIAAASRADLVPNEHYDLSRLRVVGATGAPLPPDGFDWVYTAVSPGVLLSPISGGTDVCSAFVGGSPLTPVWRGEIPARYLGCAAASFDEEGREVVGQEGELVITQPMPSMPIGFWGDEDGARYRAAYFDDFEGVWRHGDWITFTERGSCVISGRSDATLNRAGVRIGTAEIYRVVESVRGISDSLIVHLEGASVDDPGTLVLFVSTTEKSRLSDDLVAEVRRRVRSDCSPRHVPDEVHHVDAIPTTLSGKKLELPVKKILLGGAVHEVASAGALKDPAALDAIIDIAAAR